VDKTILKEIGLQEGEITLYLALLKLKETTATQIAQHTGVHRSHIYDLIEKLKEKGGSYSATFTLQSKKQVEAKRHGVAAWVRARDKQSPVQAVGGYL